jgi:hypothetical protein
MTHVDVVMVSSIPIQKLNSYLARAPPKVFHITFLSIFFWKKRKTHIQEYLISLLHLLAIAK